MFKAATHDVSGGDILRRTKSHRNFDTDDDLADSNWELERCLQRPGQKHFIVYQQSLHYRARKMLTSSLRCYVCVLASR